MYRRNWHSVNNDKTSLKLKRRTQNETTAETAAGPAAGHSAGTSACTPAETHMENSTVRRYHTFRRARSKSIK